MKNTANYEMEERALTQEMQRFYKKTKFENSLGEGLTQFLQKK